jgi:hypothetical protein
MGDLHFLVQLGIVVDDTTVPDKFSVEKDHKTVVHIPDLDPIFLFHADGVLLNDLSLMTDTKLIPRTASSYDRYYSHG